MLKGSDFRTGKEREIAYMVEDLSIITRNLVDALNEVETGITKKDLSNLCARLQTTESWLRELVDPVSIEEHMLRYQWLIMPIEKVDYLDTGDTFHTIDDAVHYLEISDRDGVYDIDLHDMTRDISYIETVPVAKRAGVLTINYRPEKRLLDK
jgi:hypothetical protein